MAHAQKPEFVFPRKGRVHLNRWGRQFSRLLAVEECGSVVVMLVMLNRPRSEVKWNCTGYPLQSPVSPSLPLPCVTVCHQVPNELYLWWSRSDGRLLCRILRGKTIRVVQSRRGGEGAVSTYVGEGGWKYIQGFSGTHKENRRLGRHRNRWEEIKKK